MGMLRDMGIIILLVPESASRRRAARYVALYSSASFDVNLERTLYAACRDVAFFRVRDSENTNRKYFKGLMPFYAVMFVVLMIATYWPDFSLWLPGILFK